MRIPIPRDFLDVDAQKRSEYIEKTYEEASLLNSEVPHSFIYDNDTSELVFAEKEFFKICDKCKVMLLTSKKECPFCLQSLREHYHFTPEVMPAFSFGFAMNTAETERYSVLQKTHYEYEQGYGDKITSAICYHPNHNYTWGGGKVVVSLPVVDPRQESSIEIDLTSEFEEIEMLTRDVRNKISEKVDAALQKRYRRMQQNYILLSERGGSDESRITGGEMKK